MGRYGKNEEKGPTLTVADVLGRSRATAKPPCDRCDSGRRPKEAVGLSGNNGDCCPACGRLLMPESV